ncbi:MAG: CoA transferase subunit A [Bacillota bacterium]|nr:CoA transferase subunit A [Bacillota bacterium]
MKVVSVEEAVAQLKDGMTIMIGGFLDVGIPLKIVEKLCETDVKDLTLINTCGSMVGGGFGTAYLFAQGKIKKYITSHVGVAPEHLNAYKEGKLEVEFYPMGSWIEKIRAGGSGLGGVLTPVGVETLVEEGKQKVTIDGKEYLIELPLRADIAFIKGYQADRFGNVRCRYLQRNNNPIMAFAADYVVCEVNEFVDELDPDLVHIVAPLIDAHVKGYTFEEEQQIYRDLWKERKRLKAG